MKLYHGSDQIVDEPQILQSERFLDFGSGFYTTTNLEQANRWSEKVINRRKKTTGYISIYELDLDEVKKHLHIIQFSEPNELWLNFISNCRLGKPSIAAYDMVIGPVADDNVYTTVKLFETGVLDKDETIKRLKIEKLFDQVLFHTEKSLSYCTYQSNIKLGD